LQVLKINWRGNGRKKIPQVKITKFITTFSRGTELNTGTFGKYSQSAD
jgi:hypothetical protein